MVSLESNPDAFEDCFNIFRPYCHILVVKNLVTMHTLHQLQDEFANDIVFVGSDIDSTFLHTLKLVEVILQHLGWILTAHIVFVHHNTYPDGVIFRNKMSYPPFVVASYSIF